MYRYVIDNVVSFELVGNNKEIDITENCEHYYGRIMNKEEFKQMIDELTKLYEKME